MSQDMEILGPPLDRNNAIPLIEAAVKHFSEAKRATIQVMADLRRLQDGQVHVLYGYTNFSKWAEDTFDGLAAGNVRQLCRAGAVVLELCERGIMNKDNPKGVGTRALRELSTIAGTYGYDKMVEFLITAKDINKGEGDISATHIEAAMRVLMPPAQLKYAIEESDLDRATEPPEEDEPELDPKMQEIIDRIRDLSWDLPESRTEMTEALLQMNREIKGAPTTKDDKWTESSR